MSAGDRRSRGPAPRGRANRHGASRLAQVVMELHRERPAPVNRRETESTVWTVTAPRERERRVAAVGDVDRLQAALLKSQLLQLGLAGARVIVVDLTAARDVDGGVIAALLSAGRRLQWRDVELRIMALAGSPAARLLQTAGLPTWIDLRLFGRATTRGR